MSQLLCMKKLLLLHFLFIFSAFIFSQTAPSAPDYSFYENKGQLVDQAGKENLAVKYLFHSTGLNVQLKKDGFSYDVYEVKKTLKKTSKKKGKNVPLENNLRAKYDYKFQFHRVDIDFIDANTDPAIIAEGRSADYENYYNLPTQPKGVENVHRFSRIIYKNLYANIDLIFFKPEDTLKPVEYNFIVNPGGKISDIKLKFNGAKTSLKDGKLSMKLRFGEMQENIPHSWEEEGTAKNTIYVQFKDLGNQTFGFTSEKNISDKNVVIDPVPTRIWGSYFGGSGEEFGELKADKDNNIYIFGYSASPNNIATAGAYQNNISGGADAFISKISKDGQRFWGTYYGKPYFDTTGSVDTDEDLNVYAAIISHKPNPAYPGNHYYAYQKLVFLKLNSSGNLVAVNEYGQEVGNPVFGGYQDETNIYDVRYFNNKVYVLGDTRIAGYGTPGAFQENINVEMNGFLGRFDANTAGLDYFTYIGGNASTTLYRIFNADSTGLEISGMTRMTDFPMLDAFQSVNNQNPSLGGNNGLYVKFSESGNLLKSSYFGGGESYIFTGVRRFGNEIIFGGRMTSKNKICYYKVDTALNAITDYKELDVFNTDGDFYIDDQKNIFAASRVSPNDSWANQVTTSDAYMPAIGRYISILATKYDLNFNRIWSTFYVGDGGTQIGNFIKDNEGYLYLWGLSSGNRKGIATPGTFQQTGGHPSNDIFIAKFADCKSNVTFSYTPTCIGQNLQLNASGGTTYEWFGPNGFHSLLQNPVRLNAQANDSGEYFVRITGGQSCGGIFSLMITVGSPTLPVLDNPNLPDLTALCSLTVKTIPTATTGCGTKIFATTTDPLTYTSPGTYVIHWNYNDGAGNTLTQNQKVIIQGIALPTAASPQNFCARDFPRLSDVIISGTDIKWYDTAGVLLNPDTLLVSSFTYYATQTINGCESAKTPVLIDISSPYSPLGDLNQEFCAAQNPTVSDIVVVGQNVKWYDSADQLLLPSTPLVDGQTYYGTQTINGCESLFVIPVKVSVTNGGIPAIPYSTAFCNDTTANTKSDNLFNYKANLIANPSDFTFDFFDENNQTVPDASNVTLNVGENIFKVKISNALGCFEIVELKLTLNPKPVLNLRPTEEFCTGQSVGLDAGAGFDFYEWTKEGSTVPLSNEQILKVTEAGTYSVKVKNIFRCENSATVTVKNSVIATILRIDIVNTTATVILSESGDFLYSLDNQTWQTSNIFSGLKNGNYTVYVKTLGGCIIGQMDFTLFNVNNSFSPNGDGINDTWKIGGLENYPGSEVLVYDRLGRMVLSKITKSSFEWEGKFESRNLPTGNYWYVIKVSDGRILNGWLLLKNRN